MEALRAAFAMFRAQKLRFMLTVSGVVVGVASLVLLASLLEVGEAQLVAASTSAIGADVVSVSNDWERRQEHPGQRRLDRSDMKTLGDSLLLDDITFTANYGMRDAKVQRGTDDDSMFIIGVTETTLDVYNLRVADGRPFHSSEYTGTDRVALVGAHAFREHDGLAVGDTLKVEGVPFRVVGKLVEKPDMGPGGHWGWNNRIIIPARTFNLEFNNDRRPSTIDGRVAPPGIGTLASRLDSARMSMGFLLMQRREFQVFKFEGGEGGRKTEVIIVQVIEALILLTTVFSMIVGGINIMNIMLVTVTERTSEIGVRRALGATQGDIRRQFLAESIAVTGIGAAMGTLLAVGGVWLASHALTVFLTPWPFHLARWSLVAGIVLSVGIGLIFGLLPAARAARLDPVEALRSE